MKGEEFCEECGTSYMVETHHIVFRSECKPLENCNMNHSCLCPFHHRDHKKGVHHNRELNKKYKLQFQNELEMKLLKNELTREEVQEVLVIKEKPLDRLLKTLTCKNSKYIREEVIRACMGGKSII